MKLEQPSLSWCYVQIPAPAEYEHSIAICPSSSLQCSLWPGVSFLISLTDPCCIKGHMSVVFWWTQIIFKWLFGLFVGFFHKKQIEVNSKGSSKKKVVSLTSRSNHIQPCDLGFDCSGQRYLDLQGNYSRIFTRCCQFI